MPADDDHCAICADVLTHVAVPRCGHAESCATCGVRLRVVLRDARCVICQVEADCIFVCRVGQEPPPASAYDGFPAAARAGKLHRLAAADAYFDDAHHYASMKALTAITHPALAAGGSPAPVFNSMKQLRAALAAKGLHLCPVCVDGRKLFAAEQQVYSEAALARHRTTGDADGPLAESGFKGHPACRFCRRRFYGDGELFAHMREAHEHCFLCRRADPDDWTYFQDYASLASHFASAHHACAVQSCLDARFVVFGSAAELAAHAAREHAGGGGSRAERRAALTIPIDVQYRPHAGVGAGGGSSSGVGAAGRRRAGGGGGGRDRERARAPPADDPPPMPAPQPRPTSPVLRDSDFPAALGGSSGALAGAGRGRGRGRGGGRWSAAAGGSSGASSAAPTLDDFPALGLVGGGGAMRQPAAPVVRRVAAAAGPPPSRATFPALSSARPPPPRPPPPSIDAFPALGPSAAAVPRPPPPPPPAARPSAADFPALGGGGSGPAPSRASTGNASTALRDANRALLAAVVAAVGDGGAARFRAVAADYANGRLTAPSYVEALTDAGLEHLVGAMVATMPAGARRAALFDAAAAAGAPLPATGAASWTCAACTLHNAAGSVRCEACGKRAPPGARGGVGPPRGAASGDPPPHGGRKPKFERVRLTSGDAAATRAFLEASGAAPVRPGNVWTHRRGGGARGGGR